MNTKTTFSKGLGVLTLIAVAGLFGASALVPLVPAHAADVLLVSVAITASPGTICVGQSSHLTWSSTDATSISINQGIGSVLPYGDIYVSPSQTTTYTITGSNSTGGFGTASATVFVTAQSQCVTPTPYPPVTPTPQPTLNISTNPAYTWDPVGATTVSWNSTNASNCSAMAYPQTSQWSGAIAANGSRYVTGITANTTFVIDCYSPFHIQRIAYFTMNAPVTPTPVTPPALQCNPFSATANSGDWVSVNATGGSGTTYIWSAPNGSPTGGFNQSFSTRFFNSTGYPVSQAMTVQSGGQSATCYVSVASSYVTPTYGPVSIQQTVLNLTQGGQESSGVNAVNGDRLQFTIRLTTGANTAFNVHVRDWLPSYVSYVGGSTTIDGARYVDGITSGALRLGTLLPNRTYTIRFTSTLNGAYPSATLQNVANVHADGMLDQTSATTIWVGGTAVVPTGLAVTIAGRNITHGQTGEYATVTARGNETLDIIMHVRNRSTGPQYNVQVTNILPAGLTYIPGSTSLNGIVVNDGITTTGINIGTLSAGQEAIVKISVTTNPAMVPATGSITIRDTVQARADGTATISAQLPIILSVTWSGVYGVKTGPADSLVIAALFGAILTVMYGMYTRTSIFGRRYALASIRQQMKAKPTPNLL